MDRDALQLQARLLVIELVLAHILKWQYADHGISGEAIRSSHDALVRKMRAQTIPELDPAMSDFFAAEIEDAAVRFVSGLEELLGFPDREIPAPRSEDDP